MFLHQRLAAASLLCVASIAVAARADVPADARKEISERYQRMNKAYLSEDLAGIEQAFAPDCIIKMVGEPMQVRLKQFIDGTRGSFRQIAVLKSSIRTTSLKAEGEKVVATITWIRKSRFSQPADGTKAPTTIVREGTQTIVDTWTKTDRGWKIQRRLIKAKD